MHLSLFYSCSLLIAIVLLPRVDPRQFAIKLHDIERGLLACAHDDKTVSGDRVGSGTAGGSAASRRVGSENEVRTTGPAPADVVQDGKREREVRQSASKCAVRAGCGCAHRAHRRKLSGKAARVSGEWEVSNEKRRHAPEV